MKVFLQQKIQSNMGYLLPLGGTPDVKTNGKMVALPLPDTHLTNEFLTQGQIVLGDFPT